LKIPFDQLIHRFLDFFHVAFWAVQEAENEFALPGVDFNQPKIQLGCVRESDVSNVRLALRDDFLPLDKHKMRLG